MRECKKYPSRNWKTFLAWGNVKNSEGGGKNVPVLPAGLSILGNGIFCREAKGV
jgi:hypothetical protein